MAAARGALVPERGDVNGRDDDSLARPRTRLGEHAPVEVYDHAAARPGVRGVVLQARALVGGDDVGRVLNGAAAVDDSPPVHRRRRAPRVHVGGDTNQDLRAVRGELADGFGEKPVIADGAADATDLRVGDGEQRLVVALYVVRA